MSELLLFLVEHFSFLYNEHDARFVESRVQGSNVLIVLEVDGLRLRFVRERGQLFLDFQSLQDSSRDDWFSLDIVYRFITGKVVDSAELDCEKIEFIKRHFKEIADAFSSTDRAATEKAMHAFEDERARRLFG